MVAALRTCHILARPISGATATMEFVKAEISAGLHPTIICPASTQTLPDVFEKAKLIPLDVKSIKRFAARQSWRYVSLVLDTLRGHRFDVVLVYAFRGCGLLPVLGRQVSNTWLMNIRNSNLNSFGWKATIADNLTYLESLPFRSVLVCDTGIGERMLGKHPFHVVPNGADLQKFSSGQRLQMRQELGFADSDQVIIYIGTLVKSRRPVRMLETFEQVAKARPEARLMMVGGSDQLPELIAWGEAHQLADRITFTGRVPYDVIQNYVAAADIGFAYYPSLAVYQANVPLKTAELLAAGLPTVATDTEGNRIYITHEENGLLAKDDPTLLAKAILRLFDEPELTERLRNNAKASVTEFDWQQIVRRSLFPL